MSNKQNGSISATIIKAVENSPIQKAEGSTALTGDSNTGSIWLEPNFEQYGFASMVKHSSILPQCISAYKNNIAGFGIGIRYIDDTIEETAEMKAEYSRAEEIIDLLNTDMDTKEVFEDVVDARETYGVSYLEVIRNFAGEVSEISFIKDVPTIRKTYALEPAIQVDYYYKGKVVSRQRRFCKYKQTKNGKTVYFKEFGDSRIMDNTTGVYLVEGETLDHSKHANEILEFAIGTEDYGEVRWMGQILNVSGSRQAEELNKRYFDNGRHTPLAIIVRGGTLSDDSFSKLQDYMNGVKGPNGQHSFLVLEVEANEERASFTDERQPEVELKDLASILQKDELFQDYIDNNRRRTQSSFRLPDLYVAYTTDYNRATAQTAMEVAEKQVFQPERLSLAWAINNKLLNAYAFKYVEVYFKSPDITNPDDLYKILTVTEKAGGLTPNKAKEIAYKVMGETSEDYKDDWGNVPLAYQNASAPAQTTDEQLTGQIEKALANKDEDIVPIMKEVRKLLLEMGGAA